MEHKQLNSFQAAKNIIQCSFQLLLGFWCVDIMMSINLHYLSKYTDKITTSAFGIAYLIVSMAIVPICYGTNQTLNQQSAQAMGQNKIKLSLIYLNFTIYIHIFTYIPFCIFIYLCKTPFSYLIKEAREETIDKAWNMIIPIMIACFIVAIFDAFKNYLISCGVFNPFLPTHIITLLIHLFLCSQLVENFGYMGVCLSIVLAEICLLCMILCYISRSKMKFIFEMIDIKFVGLKLKNIFKAYVYQACPLVIHIYCDFVIFFTLSLFAFQLGTDETNAQLFLSNSSTVFFKITISISIALITFIGNELSQGNIENIRTYIKSSQGLTIIILFTIVFGYFSFKYTISSFFTTDRDVEEIFIKTLPYFLLGNIIFDGLQTSLTGILKGLNKSSIVSNSTLTIYYILGVPLLCILTFALNLNLIGIWLSFGICNYILTLFYIYQISIVDLQQISQDIQNKLSQQHGQINPKQKSKLPDIIEMDELDSDLNQSLVIQQ